MTHRVKRLFLGNWMSFTATAISVDNMTTFLSGHNGSGKSTVMDAFSLVYYGEEFNMLNYTGQDRRNAAGAVHWQTPDGIYRPGNTNSYIIMEMEDANGRTYHQGLFMYSAAGSTKIDRKTYFQGEGSLEDIGAFLPENVCGGKIRMKETYASREKAFEAFFARRGYPVDTFIRAQFRNTRAETHFRRMNRAILSNTGISGKSLSDYAKENIFPAASTGESLDRIKSCQHELDRLSLAAAQLEKKAQFLEDITRAGRKNIDALKDAGSFERAAAHISCAHYRGVVRDLESRIGEYGDLISKAEALAAGFEEEAEAMRDERSRLSQEETPVTRLQQELETKQAQLRSGLVRLQGHKRYLKAKEELIGMLPDPFMIDRTDEVLEGMKPEEEAAKKKFEEDDAALRSVRDRIQTLRAALGEGLAGKNDPLAEMIRSAAILKERIREEIPEENPKCLYECIDGVTDPEWQEAIERLLGRDRFGIIVSGRNYRRACEIQHSVRGNRSTVIVLNTERLAGLSLVSGDTVPSVISFSDLRAERFVRSAYGRYVLCETAQQYGRAEYAVRKNGQTKVPNRSILHGTAQRVTKILGKEAVRKEIEKLIIQEKDVEARAENSRAEHRHLCRKMDGIRTLSSSYKNLSEFNDPFAEEDVRKTGEEIAELEGQIRAFSESEESKKKEAELERLSVEIEAVNRKKNDALRQSAGYANSKTAAEKELKENTEKYRTYSETVEKLGPLTEEDRLVIRKNDWERSLIGNIQTNIIKRSVDNAKAAAAESLRDKFVSGRDILASMPGAPMTIADERQLAWFTEEAERVAEVRMDKGNLRQIERLRETLRNQFAGLLHSMHQDLVQAQEIRTKFNSFLPRYRIGICYYRLGPIRIRQNMENSRLMELAEKQERGEQLSPDDIDYVDRVFEKVISSAEHGIVVNPFDYRQYITTSMEYRTETMDEKWQNADRTSSTNSNGQQAILRYIVKIVVLASQAFSEKSLRFCIIDEVLQGVDDVNSSYFFDALKEMNIQCIIASMDPRFAENADDSYQFRMVERKYTRINRFGIRKKRAGQEPA